MRRSSPRTATMLAAGVALLGAATLLVRRSHFAQIRTLVGARYDEASGRGRAGVPASPVAREAGHETLDMRGGLMGKLFLLLGAVAFCMVFAMIGLRVWVTNVQRANQPALSREQTAIISPPGPHLQRDPLAEIAGLNRRQDARLSGYGYLDAGHTHARIPIDGAIALTIGQPLAPPP